VKIAYFTHSLRSCWNHGNAHFVRGVLGALVARGHDVRALEPAGNWSLTNLLADAGEAGLDAWRAAYPELGVTEYLLSPSPPDAEHRRAEGVRGSQGASPSPPVSAANGERGGPGWGNAAPDGNCGPGGGSPTPALPALRRFASGGEGDAPPAPVALIANADLVIVHEWNDPALVASLGRARARGGRFTLLFHDTHHRAVSDPDAIRAFDLSGYDGVLAFGEALSEVYRRWGWGARVWTWHEAADVRRFHPPAVEGARAGLVWIGNWGDGERTAELETFLLAPARAAGLTLDIYGVRYPAEAQAMVADYGARYGGWLANAAAPGVFARHLATVHVPRRFYTTLLPGIPTIRVFEALACGIPLVSAPWDDAERLFRPGDYLTAADGAAMTRQLAALRDDLALRAATAAAGLETILARHTCDHRADELLAIVASLRTPARNVA